MNLARRSLLAAVAACALVRGGAASGEDAPPRAGDEIEAAHRLVTEWKWKDAKAAYDRLFAANTGNLTIVSHLNRIEEDLKLCGCRLAMPADLKRAFPLAPLRYDSSTRAAEFRATSVPVPFEDEARMELEWKKGETANVPPDVLVRIGDGRLVYAIRVAAAPGTGGVRASVEIHRLAPAPAALIERSAARGMDASRLVTGAMDVEITPKLTRVTVNGYEIGRAGPLPRRDAATLSVGASNGAGPSETHVVMKVDRDFARRAADESERADVAAWAAKSWDRTKELPRWAIDAQAFAFGAIVAFPPGEPAVESMEEARQALVDHYEDTESSRLHAQTIKRMPPLLRRYVTALGSLRSGELQDAEEGFLDVVGGAPSFVPARVGLARVHFERGRLKEVRQELETTRESAGRFAPWYELGADVALLEDDPARAAALLGEAIAKGAATECTLRMSDVLRARDTGPSWPRGAKLATARLDVTGDADAKTCQELAALVESTIDESAAVLGPWPAARRARLFVFSDERAYRNWTGAFGDDRRPAPARFVAPLRHLAVLAGRDVAKLRRHVRHEAFRLALDAMVREPPGWFAEGFASAFGDTLPEAEEGWLRGDAEPRHVLVNVGRGEFVPLRDLFLADRSVFRSWDTALARGLQAWTVAESMRRTANTDPAIAAAPKAYAAALAAGASRESAYAKALAPVHAKLEAAWRADLDALGK